MAKTSAQLGDLDGTPIELVRVKLAGTVGFTRRLEPDERVILLLEVFAAGTPTLSRTDAGKLVRTERVTASVVAELDDKARASWAEALLDTAAGRLPFATTEEEEDTDV